MDFKDRVKDAADIVRVIGEVVRLKPLGPNRFVGLCPFHQEKTPSFNVHRDKQFFYCFGCQKGGDVFRFVMEIEGVGFFDALKSLAERHGIPVPQRTDLGDAESRERDAQLAIQKLAFEHFRHALNAEARGYLERRNVRPETADEFGLGYAPPGATLVRRLQQQGFSPEQIAASGLAVRRDDGSLYDRFRHRLMFPIHNESGQVIAFGGRAFGDDEPKYLNSAESVLYTKKRVLYNLHRAKETIRRAESAVLVEGYMDVIGLVQAGVRHAVASCGTALSEEHVRALRRHADRIVVNFDPDKAGQNATERSIQTLLSESMRVRVLVLDGGLDPDEFIAVHGVDAYRQLLDKAETYFHWLAARARSRFDMTTAEGRMEGFRALLKPALDLVPDPLEKLAIASDLGTYLGVDSRAILDQLKRQSRGVVPTAPAAPQALPGNEALLVRCLLDHPTEAPAAAARLAAADIWRTWPSAAILETIMTLGATDLRYESVAARSSDRDRAFLASAVLADKHTEQTTVEQLEACLAAIESQQRQRQIAVLRRSVRELERAGRLAEAISTQKQIDQLLSQESVSRDAKRPRGTVSRMEL